MDFGALPNATTKSVSHGISNFDRPILVSAICRIGSTYYPLTFGGPSALNAMTNIGINATNISINTGVDRSDSNAIIALEYVKTS